jgi:hypothetical protein
LDSGKRRRSLHPRLGLPPDIQRGCSISGETVDFEFDVNFRGLEAEDLAQGTKRRTIGAKSFCHSREFHTFSKPLNSKTLIFHILLLLSFCRYFWS